MYSIGAQSSYDLSIEPQEGFPLEHWYVRGDTRVHDNEVWYSVNYNMTGCILAGNYISFTIAAGLIRLHMPGVKKSRV